MWCSDMGQGIKSTIIGISTSIRMSPVFSAQQDIVNILCLVNGWEGDISMTWSFYLQNWTKRKSTYEALTVIGWYLVLLKNVIKCPFQPLWSISSWCWTTFTYQRRVGLFFTTHIWYSKSSIGRQCNTK